MRNTFVFVLTLALFAGVLAAQNVPDNQIYVGYSYLNVDTNGLTSRQGASGWEASVSSTFNKRFGVEVDTSGYYRSASYSGSGMSGSATVSDYVVLGGPRLNFKPVFVHALFGFDHLSASGSTSGYGYSYSGSGSDSGWAMAVGGGVQIPINRVLAWQSSFDYLLTDHYQQQHNLRASTGLVYRFGTARTSARANSGDSGNHQASVQTNVNSGVLQSLGISSDHRSIYGFTVTAVAPGSPAERAKIAVGDIIVALEGTPSKGNKVHVTLSKPYWPSNQTEQRELTIE